MTTRRRFLKGAAAATVTAVAAPALIAAGPKPSFHPKFSTVTGTIIDLGKPKQAPGFAAFTLFNAAPCHCRGVVHMCNTIA